MVLLSLILSCGSGAPHETEPPSTSGSTAPSSSTDQARGEPPAVARLASTLTRLKLCSLGEVVPVGRIVDSDELAASAPFCGDACRSPRPLTTAVQRTEVYNRALYPLVEVLDHRLPLCHGAEGVNEVIVVTGFETGALDRHVGRAIASVVAQPVHYICEGSAPVEGDETAALLAALDDLNGRLEACVRVDWATPRASPSHSTATPRGGAPR